VIFNMKRIINEINKSEYDNLKKVVFKYYDKLKLQGKKPRLDDSVVKAILTGFDEEFIKMVFIDYLGGMDKIISNLKRATKNKVFNTDDYSNDVDMGSYSFRFKLLISDKNDLDGDVYALAQIMDGELSLAETGKRVDFDKLGDDKYEDILWEITIEIGDIVSDILRKMFTPYTGVDFGVRVDYQ